MNDQDYSHIVVNYASDQEGQDIKDEHMVVWPSYHGYCGVSGDNEIRRWRLKSSVRYPMPMGAVTTGAWRVDQLVNNVWIAMTSKGLKARYTILNDDQKILDSITIGEILKGGHDTAKVDQYFTLKMRNLCEFNIKHLIFAISRIQGNKITSISTSNIHKIKE